MRLTCAFCSSRRLCTYVQDLDGLTYLHELLDGPFEHLEQPPEAVPKQISSFNTNNGLGRPKKRLTTQPSALRMLSNSERMAGWCYAPMSEHLHLARKRTVFLYAIAPIVCVFIYCTHMIWVETRWSANCLSTVCQFATYRALSARSTRREKCMRA